MSDADQVKKKLLKKQSKPQAIQGSKLLSSGSILLNLACTGSKRGAYPKGTYIYFVGDSDSGKTWYSMSLLAEACINKRFDDYRLIYDPAEGGAQMDIEYYFGTAVADRLEAPDYDENEMPLPSEHVEGFYINLDKALEHDQPCIYILDSMDALNPREVNVKFEKDAKDIEAGRDVGGTYGTAKAKLNSTNLRRVIPKLRTTESILIIISQTRDNIGFGAQFNPKTRGGGRALKFYADIEIWTSVRGAITKTVRKKKRFVGNRSLCKIVRSRVTGKRAEVTVPFYHEHGIDDIGSMVEYLIDEGYWKLPKGGRSVTAEEFDFKGTPEKLISMIEENEHELQLASLVASVWRSIADESKIKRKRRYV